MYWVIYINLGIMCMYYAYLIYVAKSSAHIVCQFVKIIESLSIHAKQINGNPAKESRTK